MIARIAGRIEQITDTSVLIDAGNALWYEVLIPAMDVERLAKRVDRDVVLYTIHYIEGDPARGAQTPRLIGFATEEDREFFRILTKVKGLGNRKALRALARGVSEIATAIVRGDEVFLATLPEIGKRTAQQIVAELRDKVAAFAVTAAGTAAAVTLPAPAAEAVSVLVQLGERRGDAVALVERVLAVAPELTTTEEIIRQAYKLRGGPG